MNIDFNFENCTVTENSFLNKIESKEKMSNEELKNLAYYFSYEEEKKSLDEYTQRIKSIVRAGTRCFAIDWISILLENGKTEDLFQNQPYEVRPVSHQKVITVTEWIKI